MPAALAAAHIGRQIEHSSAFMGFLIGAAVGLAVGVALVAATVATGGAALVVVAAVGGAVAMTGGGALAGKYIGEAIKNPKGPISSGSANVFYGPGKFAAARAVIDTVACQNHGTKFLATGSDSVFINDYPAVRDDDKSECDGTVHSDLGHILIGAETVQYLEIESEVPEWMVKLAEGMVIVGSVVALVAGGAAAFVAGSWCGLGTFALSTIGGEIGSRILGPILGDIGEAIGGELGRRIGETAGSLLGGMLGGRAGLGLGRRTLTGHPVDVATGELYTAEVDFTMGGVIPLGWERFWISSSTQNGALGHKWHHPLNMELAEVDGFSVLRVEHGRLILLPQMQAGQSFYHRSDRLTAIRDSADRWTLRTNDGLLRHLSAIPGQPGRFRLQAITDDNGNAIRLEHDPQGRLAQVVASDGVVYVFTSDEAGRFTRIARTDGQTTQVLVQYQYDPAGNLMTAIDAAGSPFAYAYRQNLLIRETRRSGLSFHFEWDDLALATDARCIRTWGDGNIYWREIEYDLQNRVTAVRNGKGHVERYFWNEIGLVEKIITPMGAETTWKFNAFAECLLQTDPTGLTEQTVYDGRGRITATIDKSGARHEYTYATDRITDPNFLNVATHIDPLGHQTTVEYDARGNVASLTDAADYTSSVLRDARGLPLALRDAGGALARFSWLPQGYLSEERTSKGGRIRYEYDSFGRVIGKSTEGGDSLQFVYDIKDNVVEVRYSDGGQVRLEYDSEGKLISHTDPTGHRTRWQFAGLPDPVLRINPDETRFQYRYDDELLLTALENEVGESYRLEYDADERLITEIGFDGRRQSYEYDLAGQVALARDGHREHRMTRDPMGRMLRRDSSDGQWASYEYDALGHLTGATNPARRLAYRLDPRGLVSAEDQDGLVTEHVYSPRGERTAIFLPDGRHLTFGQDQDGNFEQLGFQGREVLRLSHDRMGRETLRHGGAVTQRTEYDPQGRIERQLAYRRNRQDAVFGRSYSYDMAGQIRRVNDLARGDRAFQYDSREQLRRVTGDVSEIFAFDPAGNIIADVESPRDASVRGGRLLMRGDNHYEYDDAGNRIRMERGWGGRHVFDYAYDALNQLIEVRETRGRGQRVTRFAYDALGRRVTKHHREEIAAASAANDQPDGAATAAPEVVAEESTWFLWDGDVLLAEARGDQSGAPDPLALVYVHEPETFRPAAQIRRFSPQDEGEVLIYWLDHLGTPQELTNENGELVWQVALKAWGGIDRVLVEQVGNNLRFQGQYYDAETGLHYNRHRHYDPAAGCFINQDPIGLLGGAILAGYVPNPLHWVDPQGLTSHNYKGAGGKGYVVYGLRVRSGPNKGQIVYVGQTETQRYTQRMGEHTKSGRLHGNLEPVILKRAPTYGQARGYEQGMIDKHGTLDTSQRGQPLGKGTEANRARSIAEHRLNNPRNSRERSFSRAFKSCGI